MNDNDLEVDDIRDIADFLAKPVQVSSGVISTSDAAGSLVYSQDILTLFNAQNIWVNKIQGFLNFRADIKLRLVINPTPFQAGLLRMSYFPVANRLTFESTMHLLNRKLISQLPGAYLNMNDNFVEVTVPYVAPTSFIQRDEVSSGNVCSWGTVYIHLFEALRTGSGPVNINWTLWMSCENLQLSGMCQPQMAEAPKKRRQRPLAPQDQEANSGRGPIGKIMSSGMEIANTIGSIPALAPMSKPAFWVLKALRGVADAFGWSKPSITDGPCKMVIGANHYSVNSRGNDVCAPMSLDPDNKIMTISDASPGGMDEMSFNFVKTRWAYLYSIPVDTTVASGTNILSQAVLLDDFRTSETVGGNTVYSDAPCSYLGNFYSYWRGSVEFRLRLVKTGFHTGTLSVGFEPGRGVVSTPAYSNAPYNYRQIIDIQDGTEFVFNCPYLIAQDWLSRSQRSGVFYVHVVNPIRAPATVSSTIDIVLEVRGGPDLMYSVPRSVDISPFVPQGIDNDEKGESTSMVLGASDHLLNNVNHCQLSIGEVQLSVLELLKANYSVLFSSGVTLPGGFNTFTVACNAFTGVRYNGVSTSSAEYGADPFSAIGAMYAFSRGSTRYRFIPQNYETTRAMRAQLLTHDSVDNVEGSGIAPTYSSLSAYPNSRFYPGLSSTASTSANRPISSRIYQAPTINGGVSIQAPFYSRFRYDLNAFRVDGNVSNVPFTNGNSIAFSVPNVGKGVLLRSAGDDYQLSYFVGCPAFVRSGDYFNVTT